MGDHHREYRGRAEIAAWKARKTAGRLLRPFAGPGPSLTGAVVGERTQGKGHGHGRPGATAFVSHLTVDGLAHLKEQARLDPLRFGGRLTFEKRILQRIEGATR